jgi:adenylate cyclase
VYLVANPELLMPTIREGATDDELMLLLDSLSLRIQNAMAALYLVSWSGGNGNGNGNGNGGSG